MADSEDLPPLGPDEDSGQTGRRPVPPSHDSTPPQGDVSDGAADDDHEGFFAELERHNRGDDAPRRAEPDDFGFDEISRDEPLDEGPVEEPTHGRGSGAGRSARSRGQGARRRGGKPPSRPPRSRSEDSPFANPRVRVLLGVVLVVVVVAVVVLIVRDYERNQLVSGYTSYVTKSGQIAQESAALGGKLITTMENTSGQPTAQLQADLNALATQAAQHAKQAAALDVPSGAVDANRALELALQYRATGLSALATNLSTIVHSSSNATAASTIASGMQEFLASDVIVQDSYLADTAQALRNQSITGVSVVSPDTATFLQGNNQQYVLASGAEKLLTPLRHVGSETSGQGAPRGLSLVSVLAEPGSITLTPGIAQTIPESGDLHWAVTVLDGGSFVENGIAVSASLSYGSTPVDKQSSTIKTISPHQQIVLSVNGPQASAVKLGTMGQLHVQVATVPGEQNTSNNAADYPITITFN